MRYAIKDATNVTFLDASTKKPVLYADYLNKFGLELNSESTFAKAKGVNKIAFEGAKTGTVNMEAEVFDLKFLAIMLGSDFQDTAGNVAKREVFDTKKGSVTTFTLAETPIEGSVAVLGLEADGKTLGKEIQCTVKDKVVTATGGSGNGKVEIFYMTNKSAVKKMVVDSKSNGKNFILIGDTVVKGEDGQEEFVQIKVNNCKIQQKFNLDLSADSVAKLTANFDLLADEDDKMVELTLID